jgi:hypothetical protein
LVVSNVPAANASRAPAAEPPVTTTLARAGNLSALGAKARGKGRKNQTESPPFHLFSPRIVQRRKPEYPDHYAAGKP